MRTILPLPSAVLLFGFSSCAPDEPILPGRQLKILATAQADFQQNDRDGDGKKQFWRADVAGLYGLIPKGETHPIKLIEAKTAAADERPATDLRGAAARKSRGGYWFRAVRNAGEEPAKLDPNRFAFCAYPDDPSRHRFMYIVNEGNTVFQAPAVKGGVDVFPDLDTLKAKWSKLD